MLEEAVREARELRDLADAQFRLAVLRASQGGMSLRAIARVAGLTFSGVAYIVRREKGKHEFHN